MTVAAQRGPAVRYGTRFHSRALAPETTMAELTRRYVVMTLATEAPFDPADPDGVFVLKPWKDPAALRALETYRDHAYPELAAELAAWIATIERGPRVRGGVGSRNEAYAASRTKRRKAASGGKGPKRARRAPARRRATRKAKRRS